MSVQADPVIWATTRWLVRAYPGDGGALAATLAELQAGQAVTVAAGRRACPRGGRRRRRRRPLRGTGLRFRRLTGPSPRDRRAATLLRHPDLLAPVADLHRDALLRRLYPRTAAA